MLTYLQINQTGTEQCPCLRFRNWLRRLWRHLRYWNF